VTNLLLFGLAGEGDLVEKESAEGVAILQWQIVYLNQIAMQALFMELQAYVTKQQIGFYTLQG
jgi:hypothetical protein